MRLRARGGVRLTQIGYFLSSEEHSPNAVVGQAVACAEANLTAVLISDHFHPWVDAQGESGFVWSVIGAIAGRTSLFVTTGVTCPTIRIHPAVIAHAAATSQLLLDGRFALGLGAGENLNEHVLGDRWPQASVRLEMLEEAVEVIREMWRGASYSHHGRYYTVESARLYSVPERPPPVLISGFGPRAIELAARIGDGFVTTKPDMAHLERYASAGGNGTRIAAMKLCYGADEAAARKLVHATWPTEALPGELNQELRTPAQFEQASSLVTEDAVAELVPCGPDPERHAAAIAKYLECGFDQLYLNQVGPDIEGFLRFYKREVEPRLSL